MLHKEFWGLVFLAYVVWVFLAANPSARIVRSCEPVEWTGNVVTSMASLVLPSQQEKMQRWTLKTAYGCRYTVWRLFYQSDYNAYLAKKAAEDQASPLPPDAQGPSDKPAAGTAEPASSKAADPPKDPVGPVSPIRPNQPTATITSPPPPAP